MEEWTPADHKNSNKPAPGQVDVKKRAGMPNLEKHGITDVVLATWKQNCVTCHGTIGRGDGPQGRALRPPNLTDPKWQKVAIDSEIAFTIKKGRGRMPAFQHLPDETVVGLIRLIRMLNSDRSAAAAPGGKPAAKTESPSGEEKAKKPSEPSPKDTKKPEPTPSP